MSMKRSTIREQEKNTNAQAIPKWYTGDSHINVERPIISDRVTTQNINSKGKKEDIGKQRRYKDKKKEKKERRKNKNKKRDKKNKERKNGETRKKTK